MLPTVHIMLHRQAADSNKGQFPLERHDRLQSVTTNSVQSQKVTMLFPLSDDDRGVSGPCYVTMAILFLNIALFVYQVSNPSFTNGWSVIPAEITSGEDITSPRELAIGNQRVMIDHVPGPTPIYLTLFTAMFMHGGMGHIFGNMLYLWIFGNNVEHRFGHVRFLIFYLASGIAGSVAQIALSPDSIIPNLGASGAIYGILGAYIVLFPRNKVNTIVFFQVVSLPAIVVIGLWAVIQFYYGFGSIVQSQEGGGVAYMAHVGGFVAGVIVAGIVRSQMKTEPDSTIYRQYVRDDTVRKWW